MVLILCFSTLNTQSAVYSLPYSPIHTCTFSMLFLPKGFSIYIHTPLYSDECIRERLWINIRDICRADWRNQGLNHQPSN